MSKLRSKALKFQKQDSSKADTLQPTPIRPSYSRKEGPSNETRVKHGNIIIVKPKCENVKQIKVKPQFCSEELLAPVHQRSDSKDSKRLRKPNDLPDVHC